MTSLLWKNDRRGEYPQSWYAATAPLLAPFARLEGETRADICVIGGGYTGLSAALHLARAGHDVVLLEAQRVGFGASGRNGGQVSGGYNQPQSALERKLGREDARALWQIAEEAKALTRSLVVEHAPDAHYRPGVLLAKWHRRDMPAALREAEHLAREYGYDQLEPLDRNRMRELVGTQVYQGGLLDRGAGHLHPLRYALGLTRAAVKAGVRIFEGTPVHHLRHGSPVILRSDRGRVKADHVVLACNGYLAGLERKVAGRVMPINNYIIATEPLGPRAKEVLSADIAVADSRFVINYFRLSEDGRLLFGGGESYGTRFPRDIAAKVRKPMLEVFPQLADARIEYAWGGTLAITVSRLPCFMRPAPNVWNASGYSGHGVALATMAGPILAEAIGGDTARFDLLARLPVPHFPGGRLLSQPVLALAMRWYAMRDRLGI